MSLRETALIDIGRCLLGEGYRFTTVTPCTHARVNGRATTERALSLRDVFGWNRPFEPGLLGEELLQLMRRAEVVQLLGDGRLQSTIRFSTLGDQVFAHSGFPTSAENSVFFGPDSYRFVRAVLPVIPEGGRVVDVGCGSGVGGIMAAKHRPELEVVLADINPAALSMARVNLAVAGVRALVMQSDVLRDVPGRVDAIISNPPFLADAEHRIYRDGGAQHGAALSLRIAAESLERLSHNANGGLLLLYTAAAVTGGRDGLLEQLRPILARYSAEYQYEELDPDVFPEELEQPGYQEVDRIAIVLLQATLQRR